MRQSAKIGLVLAAGVAAGVWVRTEAAPGREAMIGHMVYFQLNDPSPEAAKKLVAACDQHLKGHPGEVFFAAGPRATAFDRPVNDRDWDVGLHIVFKSKADHDRYAVAPRHLQFIDENKAAWKKVRVFDSLLEGK